MTLPKTTWSNINESVQFIPDERIIRWTPCKNEIKIPSNPFICCVLQFDSQMQFQVQIFNRTCVFKKLFSNWPS